MRALLVVTLLGVACAPPATPPTVGPPAAPQRPAVPDPVRTEEPADADPALKADPAYDAKYPFPRDPAKSKAVVARRRAWLETQFGGDLKTFPPAPEHAEAVTAAVTAQIETMADPTGRAYLEAAERRTQALSRAFDAGCQLPYVLYDMYRMSPASSRPPADWKLALARRFEADGYSPRRRLAAYRFAAAAVAAKADRPATDEQLAPVWAAATDLCRQRSVTATEPVLAVALEALKTPTLGPNLAKRYQRLAAALTAAGADDWLRKVVEGNYLFDSAWEARGRDDVPKSEDGARKFRERQEAAEKVLTAAHALDPDRPDAAATLILVTTGLGRGRDEMEKWFRATLTADPNATGAVDNKIAALDPFYNTPEALAFARQCLRVSTPDDRLNEYLPGIYSKNVALQPDLWNRPGTWADLRAAYEPLVIARPDDRQARTHLLRLCLIYKQYEAAERHRAILGYSYWPGVFGNDRHQLMEGLDEWINRGRK